MLKNKISISVLVLISAFVILSLLVPLKAYAVAAKCRFTEEKSNGTSQTFDVVSCAGFVNNPDYNFASSDFSNDKCYTLIGQAPTPSKSVVACDGPEFTTPTSALNSTTNTPKGADYDAPCQPSTAGGDLDATNCGIIAYLLTGINVLSGLVGVVVVVMIAIGGIQYSTARDNPQAVMAAKTRITNAILALVASLFIYAFLQYIVPGGIL